MVQICKNRGIKYQQAANWNCGTNTREIQLRASGCETMLLGIPNRYMHTQVEMCSWDDVDSCIELLSYYLEETK